MGGLGGGQTQVCEYLPALYQRSHSGIAVTVFFGFELSRLCELVHENRVIAVGLNFPEPSLFEEVNYDHYESDQAECRQEL